MRMRTIVILAALFAVALWAAPAQAKLVYVKNAGSIEPVVYVATDKGKDPRRLGIGRAPTISPDGQWVAFVTIPAAGSDMDTVVLQKLEAGSQRLVMRSRAIDSVRFSPDSSKLAAIAAGRRVRVYDIAADSLHMAAEGFIRGYSFSPDSSGSSSAGRAREVPGGERPLHRAGAGRPEAGADHRLRACHEPGLGSRGDRLRPLQAPQGRCSRVQPLGARPGRRRRAARLTKLKIPPLVSGLVPLEFSGDARRLLTVFTGQNTEVGFTVGMRTGKTRALSKDFESGIVGFDLSRGGRRILAHSGGWDPGGAHDVISVPYGGGEPKVLVEDAAYPDWTR